VLENDKSFAKMSLEQRFLTYGNSWTCLKTIKVLQKWV